jgi:hypothetical protein
MSRRFSSRSLLRRFCLSGACVAAALVPRRSLAQDLIRSAEPWRTIRTTWFDVHFPADAEAWAVDLAPRLDAIRDSVARLVGYAPAARTTVVIDDPYNVANGKAIPLLDRPAIHLWVTPPDPTDQVANHRGWGIKLAAHEFGHIAHLSRPARRSQWFWHLAPAQVSPLSLQTPRWATEGYATWIEGMVTGSGRPHGAWRAALLRELALAGRLPAYGAMSSGGGYKGGSLAYLAGSAFWEWLSAQRGDTAMPLVFRRQTARVSRSFDDAFRGVYGDAPATLYARFAAEMTAKAFAVDSAIRAGGIVTGTRLARFTGVVGAPAVSKDGKRVAMVLPGSGTTPPRVVIAPLDTQPETAGERQQVARTLRRDPQDVPAIRTTPRLARQLASLGLWRGRLFGHPRFIDSAGTRVLLETALRRRDGSVRPELALWDVARGRVHMVTSGAGVHDADPSPDGRRAVAVQCVGGVCSLVLVSLDAGTVTPLAAGSPTRVFSQPQWSPDGTQIVTSLQQADGQWHLAVIQASSGQVSIVTPRDDISRHSPAFDGSGTRLVYISEAGGIPNVESLRLTDSARVTLTRLIGSAWAPAPLPNGDVVYLGEYAGGMELYRLDKNVSVAPMQPVTWSPAMHPILPTPRTAGMVLPASTVRAPRVYGPGPRAWRGMAQASAGRDGLAHALTIASTDPANRFIWSGSAYLGSPAAWRGGLSTAAWYGSRPNLRGEAFWLEQRGTRQWDAADVNGTDLRIAGASLAAELPVDGPALARRLALSGFVGAAATAPGNTQARVLLSGSYATGASFGWRRAGGITLRGGIGTHSDSTIARLSAGAWYRVRGLRADVRAHLAAAGTPMHEQFSAGGFAPPTTDALTLAQRIAIPALPTGIATGTEIIELRATYPAPLVPMTLVAHSVGPSWRVDAHSLVVALERGFDATDLGIVGLPQLHVLGGVAYIARGPLREHASAYLSLGWRP